MSDDKQDKARVQLQAMQDQTRAGIKARREDVFRIGLAGSNGSERDEKLVKQVFLYVGALLMLSRAEEA